MKTRFIGDIHGKIGQYLTLCDGAERSIQVGDFGYGFVDVPAIPLQHRFIRGNHDSPLACRQSPNWIPDGVIENGVMYIGGAWSIDRDFRVEGVSWWRDEECDTHFFYKAYDIVAEHKPKVMVTHDCPQSVVSTLFGRAAIHTRTQQALDSIWQLHKPKYWIFGHWHTNVVMQIMGTTFICLDELSYIDIDLENI